MPNGDAIAHPAKESTKKQRCPECGGYQRERQNRRSRSASGLLAWLPMLVVAVLLAAQVASPFFMQNGVMTQQHRPANGFMTAGGYSLGLSIADLKRASQGDAKCLSNIRYSLDAFTSQREDCEFLRADPAAKLSLSVGRLLTEYPDPSAPTLFRARLRLGWPISWLNWSESAFPRLGFGLNRPWWNHYGISWTDASRRPLDTQEVSISAMFIASTLMIAALFGALCSLVVRQRRWPSARHRLSTVCGLLTIGAWLVMLVTPPATSGRFSFSNIHLGYTSSDPTVSTTMLLGDFMRLAAKPDGEREIAKWATSIAGPLEFDASNEPRHQSLEERVTIGLMPETPYEVSTITFGWPWQWLTLNRTTRDKPTVESHAQAAPWECFGPDDGVGIRMYRNRASWPGVETEARIWDRQFSSCVGLIIAAWIVLRVPMNIAAARTARRRLRKTLCVHCGYDLKGIKPR